VDVVSRVVVELLVMPVLVGREWNAQVNMGWAGGVWTLLIKEVGEVGGQSDRREKECVRGIDSL